jgi:hypothetical protein
LISVATAIERKLWILAIILYLMIFSCARLNEVNYLWVLLIAMTFSIGFLFILFLYTAACFDPYGPSSGGMYTVTYGRYYAYSRSSLYIVFIFIIKRAIFRKYKNNILYNIII